MFELKHISGKARRGLLKTSHGEIETPFFMPIATAGALKGVTTGDAKQLGAQVLLSNTYHLHLRPGEDLVAKAGGLHEFMNWDGPILTDSGGYQVFSLAKIRKLREEGVEFQSHVDGSKIFLSPEKAIEIQQKLGSDIMMCLDECPAANQPMSYVEKSLELTTRWARRCKEYHEASPDKALLFGIVQGGMEADLRKKSARELAAIGFDGYAIGGLSVGEPAEVMYEMLDETLPELPEEKPRYLMGVGTPENILEAVQRGVDMFDCVLPTRNARHGHFYTSQGVIRIKNESFREDLDPLDPNCGCQTCSAYSRAYLRHLFVAQEPLFLRLGTQHNLAFYLGLMSGIRKAIENDDYAKFKADLNDRLWGRV